MSQEMKAFPGMKASQKLNFNHSEVIINSAPDRKVILESTLLEQSSVEKDVGKPLRMLGKQHRKSL